MAARRDDAADGGGHEQAAPEPARPAPAAPAPSWTSLVRMDPATADAERGETMATLQRSAGNARVAGLLGELAPPELPPRLAGSAAALARTEAAPPGAGAALLVAKAPGPDQMTVGAFLDEVQRAVTEVAAAQLGPVFTVTGCPWLAHWIAYYRGCGPADVEEAVRRYAPSSSARTAADQVRAVTERVREGIAVWQATGQIPAPPPGAPPGPAQPADEPPPPAFKLRKGASAPTGDGGALSGRLGAGERVDGAVASRIGGAYAADLSAVRVHRDAAATQLVSSMGARAVTVGSDIAFGPGEYEPGTPLGDALIAHELAHVVQQTPFGGPAAAVGGDTEALEDDADRAAFAAVAGIRRPGALPARGVAGLRAQSCPTGRGDRVFDDEAEKLAAEHGVSIQRTPEVDDEGPAPVGFRQHFVLVSKEGPSANVPGRSPGRGFSLNRWYVQPPGGKMKVRPGDGGGELTVVMDEVGFWVVVAEVNFGGTLAVLSKTQSIHAADEFADAALAKAGTADYVSYRLLMEHERIKRAGGVDRDQSGTSGAYITVEGPRAANPAPETASLDSISYAVHPNPKASPDAPKPAKYRWWAIPRDTDMNRWSARTDLGRRTEYQGEFAFFRGEGKRASFRPSAPARVELVCELVSADDKLIETAHYQQMIMSRADLQQVDKVASMMKEGAEHHRLIRHGEARGLRATHLGVRTGATSDLTLFAGPSAKNPARIMLVDLTPGAEYVEHEGATIEAAIKHLDDNNSYGKGQILLEWPGPPPIRRRLSTDGETDLAEGAKATGIGSAVLVGLGILAGLTPLAPAAPFLLVAGMGAGAVSGGLSITDELRKAKPSATKVGLDLAGIVGSFAGAGTVAKAARMGSVELAMTSASGRFFIYTGIGSDAVSGILLAVDAAEKIEQIRKSGMNDEQKIDAIRRVLVSAIVSGGLIAYGNKDLGNARSRLAGIVGEERLTVLKPETLYTLHALDDATLQTLKQIPAAEFEGVAKAMGRDPRRAAALSKAYGADFVEELRANPLRALEETGEVLAARAAKTDPAVVGGVRGVDLYQLDEARGIGSQQDRFSRGVNQTVGAGRLQGATVTVIRIDRNTATLRMTVGGQTVTVELELRAAADLAPGAHVTTGGAGPARIADLQPPATAGGPWTASVQMDRTLLQDNVKFVLGHELDEIADFVARRGVGGMAARAAEGEASLFVSWARRDATGLPSVTSHDRAQAREYLNVAFDIRDMELRLARLPPGHAEIASFNAKLVNRRQTLTRMAESMGMLDPQHLELKLATLRESFAGMPDATRQTMLNPPGPGIASPFDQLVDAAHRGVTITEFRAVTAQVNRPVLTQELVAHIMRPNPQSRGAFLASGLHGGHHEGSLLEFVEANPGYALVHVDDAMQDGVHYTHYTQYRWNVEQAGRMPLPHEYPDPKGLRIDPLWEPAAFPKTTFDDPLRFLETAETILTPWRQGIEAAGLNAVGPVIIGTAPRIGVHFTYTAPAAAGAPGRWDVRAVFIDETWIEQASRAQRTPTPVPGAPPAPPPAAPAAPATPPPA